MQDVHREGSVMAVISNEDYGKVSTCPILEPKVFSVQDMKRLCRYYAIGSPADSIWMFEYDLGNGRRLDVLTVELPSLWVRGFEVKSSRADFTKDKKWRDYLPFVNEFFFCAPPGVIGKDELPPDVGLLEPEEHQGWKNGLRGYEGHLTCRKRPGKLQPVFVRETYTELWMTKLLTGFLRNLQWREERLSGWCECGKKFELDRDGRSGGPKGGQVNVS